MWETIRGYLTFTRKERYGVLFLLLLIIIFFVIPYFFKRSPGDRDPEAYNKIKGGIRNFELRLSDSSHIADNHDRYLHQKKFSADGSQTKNDKNAEIHMFYFDPNKIQATDWIQLGLPDRLTQTIRHYLDKGGRFQKAEDLKKLYGLQSADYERLYPFIRISRSPGEFESSPHHDKKATDHTSAVRKTDSFFHRHNPIPETPFKRAVKFFAVTDVNFSDSNTWSGLPGIGEKLASRIVHFREKLGGFYQIEQVAETYGLPDSTFQKIKPYLRIRSVSLHQIDVNSATKEILMSHPYIRWALARAITEYRLQHGPFHSVGELLQLAQMDPVKFEKLKPYLFVGQE
jgi:DNA uptake protein ComE-like DNA-binding protein